MPSHAHVPQRSCLGCRTHAARAQLLRLVIDDAGRLAVDPRAVMPGRGAWIHPDVQCLESAVRKNAFGRALRHRGLLDAAPVRDYLSALDAAEVPHEQQKPSAAPTTDCEGG